MPVIDVPRVNGRGERNGTSDKSIALVTENVRDMGATYTSCYSNADGALETSFPVG